MMRSRAELSPALPEKWVLSDHLYDCASNGNVDVVIDRLCRVIELLVRQAPEPIQCQVLATLNQAD